MKGKLIIFDCDGVLVDSELLGNKVFSDLLATCGCHITSTDMVTRFRGVKLADILKTLERETSIKLPATFEVDLRRRMSIAFQADLRPVEGALQLIEALRIPFCVASSGPRFKIEENLRSTKLYSHFEGKIFSAYEVGSWKPDPGLFLHAASDMGFTPNECVVVEDSFAGVSAGVAANMHVVALDVFGNDESLSSASIVFNNLAQVREYFAAHKLAHSLGS